MKELNEYKAEIFRRSAEKKRRIRHRRRIALAVGIPLCLSCVLTVAALPHLNLGRKGGFAANMEAACDQAVSDNDLVQESAVKTFRLTDPVDAAMVREVLEGEKPEYTLNRDHTDPENALADAAVPGEYRLTLCLADGQVLCYRIQGQAVYCETTGERHLLTHAQADGLYTLLTQVADGNSS